MLGLLDTPHLNKQYIQAPAEMIMYVHVLVPMRASIAHRGRCQRPSSESPTHHATSSACRAAPQSRTKKYLTKTHVKFAGQPCIMYVHVLVPTRAAIALRGRWQGPSSESLTHHATSSACRAQSPPTNGDKLSTYVRRRDNAKVGRCLVQSLLHT